MPSFGSGSDSQASLLIRLHLTSAYLVMNGLSQRVNCPFLPNLFVRVLALRKFHSLLRSDRARINPIAFQAPKQPRRLTVNWHHQHQQAAAVEHLNKT
jgi:hypothetical protein